MADGVARLEAAHQVTRSAIGLAAGTGVAVVLTLVLAVVGSGWGWLFGIGVAAPSARSAGAARAGLPTGGKTPCSGSGRRWREATERVEATEERRSAALVRLTGEAAELRGRLTRPVSSAGQAGG